MTTSEHTAGLIGAGHRGTRLGEALDDHDRVSVICITDVDESNCADAGERIGVPETAQYCDYERMLREEALDAVVISTPHTLHYEQIVTAFDHDLHVFCEKPLTTDLDHAADLARRTADEDRTLVVGYQRHVHPAYVAAKKAIDDVGDPRWITAQITQDWIEPFRDTWRANPELSGGGQLYDVGNHIVDAVLWTTGLTPTSVTAEMAFDDDDRRVDSLSMLTIRFASGAIASVNVCGEATDVAERVDVWGSDGGVHVEGRGWVERRVSVTDTDGTRSVVHEPGSVDQDHVAVEAETFVDAIETGATPPATARHALNVTAVTEAAYESARTGQRVSVDHW